MRARQATPMTSRDLLRCAFLCLGDLVLAASGHFLAGSGTLGTCCNWGSATPYFDR